MRRLLSLFEGLNARLSFLGSLWIVALMALITVDVVGRAFLSITVYGVPEIVKVSIVGLVWLQMAYTLQIGGHLQSRLILDRLPPRPRMALELFGYFLGSVVFILIVYSSWDGMINAWQIGAYEGEHPVRVPTAPIFTIVVVGAALTAIQFIILTVREARALAAGEDAPAAPGGGAHF
jgi:TRAP-type C4-dicarboxylate transport system permease small subunit